MQSVRLGADYPNPASLRVSPLSLLNTTPQPPSHHPSCPSLHTLSDFYSHFHLLSSHFTCHHYIAETTISLPFDPRKQVASLQPPAQPSRYTHPILPSFCIAIPSTPTKAFMSAFYYGPQHHQPSAGTSHPTSSSHNHHGGRSRRAPRLSASQNSHRQFRGVRSMKELTEAPVISASRRAFELARSFDPEDDFEFCRGLWTEDDVSARIGPHCGL